MGKRIRLIQYVDSDAILSVLWLSMWGKFLYLICEGLVPAPHIAPRKAMYAIVTTILICDVLALSSLLFPSYCSFSLIHNVVYYGN